MAHQIDILLMSAGHGGFENIVNQTSEYLVAHGYRLRYIQLVSSGMRWASPQVEYKCLDMDGESFSLEDARAQYAALLKADGCKPSLILATGWPYVIYVAKGAAADADLPVPVCAWPHDDLDYYAEGGSGDVSLFQFADMCFAINEKIARDVCDAFPGKPVYRVNNCFDESRIRYAEERDTLKLAYVGRLSEKKGDPHHSLRTGKDKEALGTGDGGRGGRRGFAQGTVRKTETGQARPFSGLAGGAMGGREGLPGAGDVQHL